MTMKHWIATAVDSLKASLGPIAYESNELDWKQNLSPKKDRLARHLSAFANHPNGGVMVFGLDEKTARPLGIEQAEAEAVVRQLANLGRDALDPPVTMDHAIVDYFGTSLLFIRVKESKIKPVHLRGKSLEQCYIRSGGTTRAASRHEVGGLLINSRIPHWEDLRISTLLQPEEVLEKLDTRGIRKLLGQPVSDNMEELLRWLTEEKLIEPEGAGYFITNFGAIAAARRLTEFEGLQRKCIRVIRYRGFNKVESIDETAGQKGYAIGFEGLINHIKGVLPHSEVIEKALLREVSVYPEIALRELIANALIHQDFSIPGTGPMIESFDNRIEFTNPGILPPSKKIDRLIGKDPDPSEGGAGGYRIGKSCPYPRIEMGVEGE